MRRQLEQLDLERGQSQKLVKEKERKIKKLEERMADLEQEKITQYNEYQEQAES